jgi:hypothetical protein
VRVRADLFSLVVPLSCAPAVGLRAIGKELFRLTRVILVYFRHAQYELNTPVLPDLISDARAREGQDAQ